MPDEVKTDQTIPVSASEPVAPVVPADPAPAVPIEPVAEEIPPTPIPTNVTGGQLSESSNSESEPTAPIVVPVAPEPESAPEPVPIPPVPTSQPEPQAVPPVVAEPIEPAKVDPVKPVSSIDPNAPPPHEKPSKEFMDWVRKKGSEAKHAKMLANLEKIMSLFGEKKDITNGLVMDRLHIADATALKYFNLLIKAGRIKRFGKTNGSYYEKI